MPTRREPRAAAISEHGPPPQRRLTARNAAAYLRWRRLRRRYRAFPPTLFFLDRGADVRSWDRATIRLGAGVRFMRDATLIVTGELAIGDGVFFNRGCTLVCHERVSIGRGSLFGEQVSIHDDNHIGGPGDAPIADRGLVTRPVEIGEHVWVGAKATIVAGVRIGDGAVIGANAVVTGDVPAGHLAAGVPARVVRDLGASA